MWKQDKKTGKFEEYEWRCEDTGENPIEMGFQIETTGKSQWATDKKGKKHKVVLVNLSTGEISSPLNIF